MKTTYIILIAILICLTSLADQATFDNMSATGTAVISTMNSDFNMGGVYSVRNRTRLQVGYTGSWAYGVPLLLGRDICVSTNTITQEGVTILNNFDYNESLFTNMLSSLTFSNLTGCVGDFKLGAASYGLPSLASLSFPNLTAVIGSFLLAPLPVLTNLYVPKLTYIGNWFQPTNIPLLKNLSLPDLMYVGGDFNPYAMAALTNLYLPSLVQVTGTFNPFAMGALRDLSFPSLTTVNNWFTPTLMASLTNFNFPALGYIGGYFRPTNMPALLNLYCPSLTNVQQAFFPSNMGVLTNMSFPSLQYVGSFNCMTMLKLTNMSFPVLSRIGGFLNNGVMSSLTNMSFPALTNIGGVFQPYGCQGLKSIEATNLASIGGGVFLLYSLGKLTSANLGSVGVTKVINGSFNVAGQVLTVASISNNLAVLNSLDGTAGTTYWGTGRVYTCSGGTSAGLSTWGPQMYTWKTNIQLRGGTVTANP